MQYRFNIRINYHEFQSLYQGQVNKVLVVDDRGRRIQLPAVRFLPFLTQAGVAGRFVLTTDDSNRFVSLNRIT